VRSRLEENFVFKVRTRVKKSLHLFRQEWMRRMHVHENRNAFMDSGEDDPNSAPVYLLGRIVGADFLSETECPPMSSVTVR
jgi:hypothetical protein